MKLVNVVAAAATVVALAVAAPPSASAAGVDPETVTLTLAPGASSTIAVRVRTPAVAPQPDIVFLADTTGSMDPALANVRNNAGTMIGEIRAVQPDARFAVAEYKEQADGNRVFTVDTPLTDDTNLVQSGMQQWLLNAGGGGVPWTDFVNAHFRLATDAVAFRPGGTRIIAWFGDAASHDPSLGHTLADATAALRAGGVRVVAVPVVGTSGDGLDRLGQASSFVNATQGQLMPESGTDQVAAALLAGLRNLTVPVTARPACDLALSATFDPATVTVRSGAEASFASTVSVRSDAAPGTYRCTVDFQVNGVSAGLTQTITVTVPSALPSLSVSDASVAEGNSGTSPAVFTVSLSGPASGPVTVHAATADGTATSPSDFTSTALDVTFAPGETSKAVSVPVVGDTASEPDETFTLSLTGAAGAVIEDGSGAGTIVDDDGGPQAHLSVGDVTVTEGDTGTRQAVFLISLDRGLPASVTGRAVTADGTATSPSDFAATDSDFTIPAGVRSVEVGVPVAGDTADEPDETFTLSLTGVRGAIVDDGTGVGTIVDDDSEPVARLSVGDVTVAEGNTGTTSADFVVSLDRPAGGHVTVHAATADGTATSPSDFAATAADVSFGPGETSKTVSVPVAGDTAVESDETFAVTLSGADGASITDGQAVGTIRNDDVERPQVSINDVTVSEGAGAAIFTVTLDRPAGGPVAVHAATANGTATSPSDFTATAVDLAFAAGETSKTVSVPVVGDAMDEAAETFAVRLSAATGATIGDGSGVGTITDDDRDGRFDCRAGAVTVLGNQPVVANPAGVPCADAAKAVPVVTIGTPLLGVRLSGGTVRTDQTPDDLTTTAPAGGDNATATAELGATRITAPGLTVELGVITSRASARCIPADGTLAPSLAGSSTIGSVRINGIPVPIGSGPVTIPLLVGTLRLNATTVSGTSVTQRAVELHTLLGDVVLGEARAGVQGTPVHPQGSPCTR